MDLYQPICIMECHVRVFHVAVSHLVLESFLKSNRMCAIPKTNSEFAPENGMSIARWWQLKYF